MRLSSIILVCILQFIGQLSAQEKASLARFSHLSGSKSELKCGVLLEEGEDSIRFLDFKSFLEESIDRKSVRSLKKSISEQEASVLSGIVPVAGWGISRVIPTKRDFGLVVEIDNGEAFVNAGKDHSIQVGQLMSAKRGNDDIKDPSTGEILGKRQRQIAEVEAVEVQDKLTRVRIVGESPHELQIGDFIYLDGAESVIAVLPLHVESGAPEDSGNRFASEMTTFLSKCGVELVERTRIDDVVFELTREKTGVIDPDAIRRIGELTGAYAVITGEVQPLKNEDILNVRAVEVSSGKILYSTSLRTKRGRENKARQLTPNEVPEDDEERLTNNAIEKAEGVKVYLSSLDPVNTFASAFAKDGRHGEGKILLGKKWPHKGLSTHPDRKFQGASVIYDLPDGNHKFFRTAVGLHDDVGNRVKTPLIFEIRGDSELIWQSPPIQRSGDIANCRIPLSGVRRLELRVNCPGPTDWAWAVWGDPRLTTK